MADSTAQVKIKELLQIGSEKMYIRKEDKFVLQHSLDEVFTKTLLMYAASYFETEMINTLKDVFKDDCSLLALNDFVTNCVLNTRNFSKLGNWKMPTPGQSSIGRDFFNKFGDGFADYIKITMDSRLRDSIRAFSTIMALRNKMIHGNLAEFDLEAHEVTLYNIEEMYEQAGHFVKTLNKNITKYSAIMQEIKQAIKDEQCTTIKDVSDMLYHINGIKYDDIYCEKILQKFKRSASFSL